MSSMTMRATLAFAWPMNERGPVWSVMTPTLMFDTIYPSLCVDSRQVASNYKLEGGVRG